MIWSNWQGAIWRGAMLVLLLWSGLAWTQTPVPIPAGAERIMIVHENGKATRCRVVESWQLPDRRIAHLLQSVASGEMITIVDEQAPVGDVGDVKNARSMAKRIFSWGTSRRTPPEGSPIPPHLRIDSGVVLKNENSPPSDAVQTAGPAIINRVVDEKVLGGTFGSHPDGTIRFTPKDQIKIETQIVEFNPPVVNIGGQNPVPVAQGNAALPASPPMANNPPAIPHVQTLTPNVKSDICEPSTNPRLVAQPIVEPCPPIMHEFYPGTIIEPAKKSWRPGDKLQAWLLSKSMPRPTEVTKTQRPVDIVTTENPVAPTMMEPTANTPFSTAMPMTTLPGASPEVKKAETAPLAISSKPGADKVAALPAPGTLKPGPVASPEKRAMWGVGPLAPNLPPGKSLLDTAAKPEPKVDPLLAPDRITPSEDKLKGKPTMLAPVARTNEPWPLNSQSVLAARSGLQGPVTYVPYPIVTVPQPHQPPMPPDPKLPEAPQLNAFVNAFSPPPMPKGQANPGQPGMMSQGNPMLAQQQMMYQQMMQQQMMQQMMAQQNMMPYGDPRMAFMPQQGPNSMMAPYRQPAPSQGPTANYARQYQGPMPPNLVPGNAPMQAGYTPAPYAPMMPPPPPMLQPVAYQQPMPAPQSPVTQPFDALIKVMRESPYPAQREWAAQQLVNFEWRTNPQIIHALLQSASQDPAVSVRAGCIYCLGRMQASVEPVLGALNALRNDADPRVRQEVEQTLVRLGQTPAAAQ